MSYLRTASSLIARVALGVALGSGVGLLGLGSAALAQDPSPRPSTFFGTVTVDGSPVPAGSVIAVDSPSPDSEESLVLEIWPSDREAGWRFDGEEGVFEALFRGVLEALPRLHWIVWSYESGPFDSLASEAFDEEWLDNLILPLATERGGEDLPFALLRPEYLPALSRFVFNEWVEILGIAAGEQAARSVAEQLVEFEWARRGRGSERLPESEYTSALRDLVATHAEILLHCHDGAWWRIHLRSAQLQARVREQLESVDELRVETVALDELQTMGSLSL